MMVAASARCRRILAAPFFHFRDLRPDLVVGMAGDINALRREYLAHCGYIDRRLAAPQQLPRIHWDVGADMPGHDDRTFDVGRIEREVGH
jgi:hypothetical protein